MSTGFKELFGDRPDDDEAQADKAETPSATPGGTSTTPGGSAPTGGATATATADAPAAEARSGKEKKKRLVYTVKEGDTLTSIAQHFDVSRKQLANINDVEDPDLIRVGQGLKVPGTGKEEDDQG